MKKTLTVLILIFAIIFLFSLFAILQDIEKRKKDIQVFEEIYAIATEHVHNEKPVEESDGINELKQSSFTEVNLTSLQALNPECVAWIYIADTPINYPVMYSPDEKNKYIHKNFYLDESASGTPFIQDGCSIESDNIIIHAHNMLNGTMFAGLKYFLDRSFFTSHPTLFLQTVYGVEEYEVWAVAEIKDSDIWYSYSNESEEQDFVYLTENLLKNAVFTSQKTPVFTDRFITLSTCYGNLDDERLILVAVAK